MSQMSQMPQNKKHGAWGMVCGELEMSQVYLSNFKLDVLSTFETFVF